MRTQRLQIGFDTLQDGLGFPRAEAGGKPFLGVSVVLGEITGWASIRAHRMAERHNVVSDMTKGRRMGKRYPVILYKHSKQARRFTAGSTCIAKILQGCLPLSMCHGRRDALLTSPTPVFHGGGFVRIGTPPALPSLTCLLGMRSCIVLGLRQDTGTIQQIVQSMINLTLPKNAFSICRKIHGVFSALAKALIVNDLSAANVLQISYSIHGIFNFQYVSVCSVVSIVLQQYAFTILLIVTLGIQAPLFFMSIIPFLDAFLVLFFVFEIVLAISATAFFGIFVRHRGSLYHRGIYGVGRVMGDKSIGCCNTLAAHRKYSTRNYTLLW